MTLGKCFIFDVTRADVELGIAVERWKVHALSYEQAIAEVNGLCPVAVKLVGEEE